MMKRVSVVRPQYRDAVRAAWRAYAVARDAQDPVAMKAASEAVKASWKPLYSPYVRPVAV